MAPPPALDHSKGWLFFIPPRRYNKLISDPLFVGVLDRLHRRACTYALPARHRKIGHGRAVPAIVTVHCIVPAAYRRYFGRVLPTNFTSARLEMVHEFNAASRRGIPAIGKEVK